MIGIREVAEQAGVSIATVSKVLNRPQTVAVDTRERVLAVIKQLGYVRNASAHQLRAGRSSAVGLLVHDIANPFFTEVASGVEQAANEAGAIVILCNTMLASEREQQYLRTLEEQRVQGLLSFPVSSDLRAFERLSQREITVVLLDKPREDVGLSWIVVDDVRGGELATSHLLARGHRQVVVVGGPQAIRQCADRLRGAQRAAQQAGYDPRQVITYVNTTAFHSLRQGELCADQVLAVQPRPTAVFCVNDMLALGLIGALQRRGIRVPHDIAVMGYDDIELAHITAPSLTTIRQPKLELGRAAIKLLLAEAANPQHHHQQIVYQPELVVRESA
jgi:LacI family transcriptional regulator